MEQEDWKSFPASCECLAECHALNHRIVYADKCVNASQKRLIPRGGQAAPFPWVDPHGDANWIRQAYTPGRRDPPLSERELSQRNLALAERLHRDGAATAAQGLCSGRGLFTEPMPWWGSHVARGKACHCAPGWFGEQCEHGPGSPMSPQAKRHCVKGCSGRGVCKLNWCHCVPGTWGVDCGLGQPDDARASAAASAQREQLGRRPGSPTDPIGWPAAMLRVAAPQLPPSSGLLRIYVYDVPPRFHVWLAAHFRREGRWDQSYLYSLDAKIHRWLLRSPYRTLDPDSADYFFVPAYLSLGYYDYSFGLYWMESRGVAFLRALMDHVVHAAPYFNRSAGADHVMVMTNDKGATFIRAAEPRLTKMVLVTQWGWVRPHIHHPGQDVVMPAMLRVDKLIGESPFMGMAATHGGTAYASATYEYLLSFVGSVRFHTPGYSMGVRQSVFRQYNATPGFFIRDLRGDSVQGKDCANGPGCKQLDPKEYLRVLRNSKFCLAPSGMGFSTRTYESMAQGCVPLVIQDEPVSATSVDQAFEEVLPWGRFSLRLMQKDIPQLHSILADFPDDKWRELRRNLACVWPRVLWLNPDNEAPGFQTAAEAQKADATAVLGDESYLAGYDGLESIMHTLGRRAMRRKGLTPPRFDWRTPAKSCAAVSAGSPGALAPVGTPPLSTAASPLHLAAVGAGAREAVSREAVTTQAL